MSKAATSLIQTGLRDLGYQPGSIDGLFGPKTNAAAQAWLLAGGVAVGDLVAAETNQFIYQGAKRYPVEEICVHCSATRPDWMGGRSIQDKRAEIKRWHLANGWNDIGYHRLIDRDGKSLAGRAENVIGAGVVGRNNGVIHICLIGGHGSSERDLFRDHFTRDQDVTLRGLIQGISMRTRIRVISGHNQYAAKACPGFTVSTWLREGY